MIGQPRSPHHHFPPTQIGQTFPHSKWTVIGEQYKINDFVWVVPVQCKCGTKAAIPRQRLFKGLSRSCVKCARKRGWR